MSRDGIIGSLFDHFHYFMISQSTLFLRLKNYKTWSYIPGTTVRIFGAGALTKKVDTRRRLVLFFNIKEQLNLSHHMIEF